MPLLPQKILCPFCFNYINLKNMLYLCVNSKCMDSPELKGHIIVNPKPDRKGFCKCDKCERTTSVNVCPHCQAVLPHDIINRPTKIISIVGAASSGKSYYVGSILRKIMDEGLFSELKFDNIIRMSAIWADKRSPDEYKKRFRNWMDTFHILKPTEKITDIVKDNPPLLIEMSAEKKRKLERNTFSFFDAAGESFHDTSDLVAITPYIAHSEAVIFILDPRQIPKVNSEITAKFPGLSVVAPVTYTELLDNVIQIIRNDTRNKNKKIKIPLCVAFSKWDLVIETPGLLPDGLACGQSSQKMASGYDEQRIETISDEIRSLLRLQWEEAGLVDFAEQNFETVKYFSFSAWGSSNSGKSGAPAIASFRIEDPLLWILHRNGVI